MPLAQPPANATPEQIAKTEQVRQKVLHHAQEKYLFRFQERRLTTGLIVENDRLAGLRVAETKVDGRKAEPIPGTEYELRAPLVVSSIGSVPELLPGVTMKGEYYTFTGGDLPRYAGSDHVYGVGNVVTGKGNIRVSLVHSQEATTRLVEKLRRRWRGPQGVFLANSTRQARRARQAEAIAVGAAPQGVSPSFASRILRRLRKVIRGLARARWLHVRLRRVDRQGDAVRPAIAARAFQLPLPPRCVAIDAIEEIGGAARKLAVSAEA